MGVMMRGGTALVVVFVATLLSPSSFADVTADILRLTGGRRTRLVWTRYHGPLADDSALYGGNNNNTMVVFDTAEGSERVILSKWDDYTMPMFTHDARRIVYADRVEGVTYVVNWDGSGKR